MTNSTKGLVFPGQASLAPSDIEQLKSFDHFMYWSVFFEDVAKIKLINEVIDSPSRIKENLISSMLVTFSNVLYWEKFKDENYCGDFDYIFAGYSVGQWSAFYAAGCLSATELVRLVKHRCKLMDEQSTVKKTTMISVVGLGLNEVQAVIQQFSSSGYQLYIANYNSPLSFSISLEKSHVPEVSRMLEIAGAQHVRQLPVSGGWHSEFMKPAVRPLQQYIQKERLKFNNPKVVDNVTGDFFSTDHLRAKESASLQIATPVMWSKSVDTLCSSGALEIFEIGHGNMLSTLGFFNNRDVSHIPYSRAQQLSDKPKRI